MELFKLRDEILKEHSKTQCTKITAWVGDDQKRFDELFGLFLKDNYRVTQRASWPLSYCVLAYPGLIKKTLGKLINNLQKPAIHDAVKRNTLRILQEIDVPKKYQGTVMNSCFQWVESPVEPVAIKVFALTVLVNLAKLYPEILPEIKLLVQSQLPNQTAAFTNRVKRLLHPAGKS